jgi:hypothetical protein
MKRNFHRTSAFAALLAGAALAAFAQASAPPNPQEPGVAATLCTLSATSGWWGPALGRYSVG